MDTGLTDGDAAPADRVRIRRARPEDGPGVGDVWLDAWHATFDFPPGHPDDDVRRWLAEELPTLYEAWVAVTPDGRVVALMAVSDTMVEQLYVAPDHHRAGIGSQLLALAKERRPDGLDLYCFQANHRARRFYEARGFVEIARGDGSGNEEHQPDIRYAWRPT
jgi:ribosomal protein S18 acetylase RimI-like enzyme